VNADFMVLLNAVLLASARLFALFVTFAMLDAGGVKGPMRAAFVMTLSVVVVPHLLPSMHHPLDMIETVAVLAKETMLGALMGYFANQLFWAVQGIGSLIDQQTGIGMAAIIDPVSNNQDGPTPGMLNALLINVMLASGGFLGLLGAVYDSFRIWPVLSYWPQIDARLEHALLFQWKTFTELIVRWSAPVIAMLMIVEFGLGLIQRFLTTLNVFFFSQCLKIAMAIFMMSLMIASAWDTLIGTMTPESMVRGLLSLAGR